MYPEKFAQYLKSIQIDTMTGVPDSTLKGFCDYLNTNGRNDFLHYVVANEGAAVGIAVGTYLSTGKAACVYMQNSGIGNAVNPLTSLANKQVYRIPMLLLIGWRGEPGIKDEPQHKFMGEITLKLLEILDVEYCILEKGLPDQELEHMLRYAKAVLQQNRQFAFVVKKEYFDGFELKKYNNRYSLIREDVIAEIIKYLDPKDVMVSSTGKISRELYEQSEKQKGTHTQCFLTVGGMGHASSIAFGIAVRKPDKSVFCLDGDGAVLMHMGSLAVIGKEKPKNLVHICLNNEAHESVGGMPTGCSGTPLASIAKACGYERCLEVSSYKEIEQVFRQVRQIPMLTFIEINVALESRVNLGRPKESPEDNKNEFMKYLDC